MFIEHNFDVIKVKMYPRTLSDIFEDGLYSETQFIRFMEYLQNSIPDVVRPSLNIFEINPYELRDFNHNLIINFVVSDEDDNSYLISSDSNLSSNSKSLSNSPNPSPKLKRRETEYSPLLLANSSPSVTKSISNYSSTTSPTRTKKAKKTTTTTKREKQNLMDTTPTTTTRTTTTTRLVQTERLRTTATNLSPPNPTRLVHTDIGTEKFYRDKKSLPSSPQQKKLAQTQIPPSDKIIHHEKKFSLSLNSEKKTISYDKKSRKKITREKTEPYGDKINSTIGVDTEWLSFQQHQHFAKKSPGKSRVTKRPKAKSAKSAEKKN